MSIDRSEGTSPYVDAVSELFGMPLDTQRRTNVAAAFARIAQYATQLTAIELDDTIEIAGEFVP